MHVILKALFPLVDALGESFGPDCEIVLHDLSNPRKSIIKIVNGHVTGRKVGDPIRDLVLTVLRSKKFQKDRLVNYLTKTENGQLLKCTTVLIRDEKDEIIGALCINQDIGRFMLARKVLDDICKTIDLEEYIRPDERQEQQEVTEEVVYILKEIIKKTIVNYGVPVSVMTREDKLNIVNFLDEKGVFLIKGSVEYVAKELNVSRFTIYNYLDTVRASRLSEGSSRDDISVQES